MKNKTLILNLIGAIFLSFRVQAGVQTSGYCGPKDEQGNYGTNCQWSLNNGILTISGNGSMADFGPSDVNHSNGSESPWDQFYQEINTVNVEYGIENLGERAFKSLENLQNINIPNSVEKISKHALSYTSLNSIDIPDSVNEIGSWAFEGCASLTSVKIPDSVLSLGNGIFYLDTSLTSVELPAFIERIGISTFHTTESLQSIVIPDGVTDIDSSAFYNTNAVIYCQDTAQHVCRDLVNSATSGQNQLRVYSQQGEYYVLDGVKYKNLSNMQKGISVKRIYTIEEANKVSGDKNRVSIKYR